MANSITLTRQDLYEKVWTTPMLTLAKEFNLSDVGLAKICKKHDIPKPGKGYWAKLAHGKRVEKRPLPNAKNNPDITIDTSGKYQEIFKSYTLLTEKSDKIKEQFQVPEVLKNPHPLIVQTKKIINENKDRYYRGLDVLDINVPSHELSRAFRIMDAFIKIMEDRGHTVIVKNKGTRHTETFAVVKGQEILIRIYYYNNKMIFALDDYIQGRKSWSGNKTTPLENTLYDIVLRILQVARAELKRTIHWRVKERERKRQEALQQEEQKRVQNIENWVARWKKSRDIQEFVEYAKQCMIQKRGGYDEDSDFGQWVKWANGYAEQINPVNFH
jgi:hypothetical protein